MREFILYHKPIWKGQTNGIPFLIAAGAIISWFTNVLAIKMLFRPIKTFRIPLLNITIQGLIPKEA